MGVRGGSDRQREGWRKEGNERKGGEIDREKGKVGGSDGEREREGEEMEG